MSPWGLLKHSRSCDQMPETETNLDLSDSTRTSRSCSSLLWIHFLEHLLCKKVIPCMIFVLFCYLIGSREAFASSFLYFPELECWLTRCHLQKMRVFSMVDLTAKQKNKQTKNPTHFIFLSFRNLAPLSAYSESKQLVLRTALAFNRRYWFFGFFV